MRASASAPMPRYVGDAQPRLVPNVRSSPPPRPTAAPTSTPIARSARAPPGLVDECATVSATVPAMKKVTNGVAMPSFSPLSTLSTRRMRAGTCVSSTTCAPSAASVGATAAAITAAAHGSRSGNSTRPGRYRARWSAGARRAGVGAAHLVVSQHPQVHAGGVGEEQERQRHLREAPERLAVHVDVDRGHGSLASTSPRATNAIGALTLRASRFAETSPHSTSDPAMATIRPCVETFHPLLPHALTVFPASCARGREPSSLRAHERTLGVPFPPVNGTRMQGAFHENANPE